MKKQFLFLLILPLMAFASIDWVRVSIDKGVSIDFPVKPKESEMSGNPVWTADANSDSRCMAMMIDFKNLGLDSAQLATEMQEPGFYDDFKKGVLGQIEGSSIISEKITATSGYRTFEYVIDGGKKDTSSWNIMYNKNIFVGAKLYTMNFFEKNGKPQDKVRDQYFRSIRIK
ncbi:MAG: hypothetical protein E6H08_06465 [Bacteroidetes bacterium]|nr:MAG: hypothetical protein E6H08_06465 [Bacteroidota bacterium]